MAEKDALATVEAGFIASDRIFGSAQRSDGPARHHRTTSHPSYAGSPNLQKLHKPRFLNRYQLDESSDLRAKAPVAIRQISEHGSAGQEREQRSQCSQERRQRHEECQVKVMRKECTSFLRFKSRPWATITTQPLIDHLT